MSSAKSTFFLFFLVIVLTCSAMAQNAKVTVIVQPSQAYIFVDGNAIRHGSGTLKLTPGRHNISVYNYGYKPAVRDVDLAAGGRQEEKFSLEKVGQAVSAPFGVIQIEGASSAAVLLNGKKPEYFVGHGDEFNNHIIWKQQLLVPAGTHNVTVTKGGKELWSGKLDVGANKRVVVYTDYPGKVKIKVKDWPEGAKMSSVPRFKAGIASATVAIAPVTANFAVTPKQIDCSVPAKLAWTTTETLHTDITSDAGNFNELPLAGEQTVSPRKTTAYQFTTSGPGGVIVTSDTLNVNPTVNASLSSTPEVRYLRVGDAVLHQESATLTWTATNVDNVVLDPIGKVDPEGTQKLPMVPEKNTIGPVDETKMFKLSASNVCGGSQTQQATVRLVGLVEPMISSIFFPTAYPDRKHPDKGLLRSQQDQLERVARVFKAYLQVTPDAKLTLTGMADKRGTEKYNFALSGRRIAIVKDFLVAKGVPADSIIGVPKGEDVQLDEAAVQQLEAQNPQQPNVANTVDANCRCHAYNRRVDVSIEPSTLGSLHFYPNRADDSSLLLQAKRPIVSKIDEASAPATVAASE